VSFLAQGRHIVERILDNVFPKMSLPLSSRLRDTLRRSPLRIVDCGGAMGPGERWQPFSPDLIRFMTFEPDKRSFDDLAAFPAQGNITLPVGLAAAQGMKRLHLTAGPFASSLYPPNAKVLKSYAVWPWYEPIGEAMINVDTLDACIARQPGWEIDFIKVDVEGADLDVLIGAKGALANVFGVQIEVGFLDRNIGAPIQFEIDRWMREAGFEPYHLVREHWLRANGAFGATTRPRLSWADTLYLRDHDWVYARAAASASNEKEQFFVRVVAILLAYGAHDYALDLVVESADRAGLDPNAAEDLRSVILKSVMPIGSFVMRGIAALTLALGAAAILILAGRRGRSVAAALVKRQATPLLYALYCQSARGGPQGGCISDYA